MIKAAGCPCVVSDFHGAPVFGTAYRLGARERRAALYTVCLKAPTEPRIGEDELQLRKLRQLAEGLCERLAARGSSEDFGG